MTTEERVTRLEYKLDEVLELLKFIIHVDDGIKVEATNLILRHLDELKEDL